MESAVVHVTVEDATSSRYYGEGCLQKTLSLTLKLVFELRENHKYSVRTQV